MREIKQRSFNEWLVIRSQQGERQAFEQLLERWQRRYLLYANNRLKDAEAAKDVTQESLISIGKGIGKLSDPAAYPKWSFTIVERRCVDWQRKVIRHREIFEPKEVLPEIGVKDRVYEKLTVEQLLGRLDSRVSIILRLHYLEGLSVNEIAHVSNLAAGTVKSRLFYGRKLIAKSLENTDE